MLELDTLNCQSGLSWPEYWAKVSTVPTVSFNNCAKKIRNKQTNNNKKIYKWFCQRQIIPQITLAKNIWIKDSMKQKQVLIYCATRSFGTSQPRAENSYRLGNLHEMWHALEELKKGRWAGQDPALSSANQRPHHLLLTQRGHLR